MTDLIKREDAIKELAEYLMMDAQNEWAGTASEDIEDWKDLAEHILKDIPPAEKQGEQMRLGTAIERLVDNYRYASDKDWIMDKVAWALYHTWKEADGRKTEPTISKMEQVDKDINVPVKEHDGLMEDK